MLLLWTCSAEARADSGTEGTVPAVAGRRWGQADSIMDRVIFFAPMHGSATESYRAELYIKGEVNVRKKNHLIRFLPTMFRIRKGVKNYLMETYNELHYQAPDMYDQRVTASVGTVSEFWEADGRLPEYFNINVYSPTLLTDKLFSPLSPKAAGYYHYQLDSVWGEDHNREFRIRFTPRFKSYQLVSGYLIVSDQVWSLRELEFSGRSEMFRFRTHVRMGKVGDADEFLPVKCWVEVGFRFLGNVIDGKYLAMLDYREISPKGPTKAFPTGRKSRYDLTSSFVLRTDTSAFRRDTAYFNALRPIELSPDEKQLYEDFYLRRDTVGRGNRRHKKSLEFWGAVGDALISRRTLQLKKLGSVRCSPIINPFLLSYSGSNGLSYRQEFKYNRLFTGDRLLRIVPKVGYNFRRKEFYWSVNSDFDYWPRKRSAIHFNVGNGNRIYSSAILDELKAMPDSIFDFNQIHLDYFKDLYFDLRHSWEIVNGLTLDIGVSIHRRTEEKASKFVPVWNTGTTPMPAPGRAGPGTTKVDGRETSFLPDWDLLNRYRHAYNSFAPRVRLTWRPGQYYYMDGDRKVNLHSRYPTVSVDWERGISGILSSSSVYERVEVDFQYNLPVGLMRDLYFRCGWGAFTNQKEVYFVDFANLKRSNLPTGWNDDIGGVFQLLDGRWYNSSRKYVRGHVTYETPFLLLRHLRKYTQYVLNERLYLNQLVVPHLNPYTEIGYGIGTHIFDFGLFAAFANGKYQEVGCKFTFELFNK